jgi:outer membrane lipoprotein-sorting protein
MKKTFGAVLLLAGLCALPAVAADTTQDVAAVLKAVDQYRTGAAALEVETRVTTFKSDGAADKERDYTVLLQADRRAIVLMRSPAEQGQKLLMLGDDFWLTLPGSQRPVRITAAQRLLGDASIGDIATMRWAGDYEGTVVGEEKCGEQACVRLDLTASRKSASYSRIELWVGKARLEPVKASLYVQSGKLAKQAQFVMDNASTPPQVVEMVLADQIGSVKETRIRYVSRKPKTAPAEWFNPMFLATNPTLD